jgi:hypothetical protein
LRCVANRNATGLPDCVRSSATDSSGLSCAILRGLGLSGTGLA